MSATSIEGFVLGEHGDSEVAAQSTVRIGGLPLEEYAGDEPRVDFAALAATVRTAGYRIIEGKGYTSFGIATAIVRICEAIVRDEQSVLPVSAFVTGEVGMADLYISLPCIVGARGVERILSPDFPVGELAALHASAAALRNAMKHLSTVPELAE